MLILLGLTGVTADLDLVLGHLTISSDGNVASLALNSRDDGVLKDVLDRVLAEDINVHGRQLGVRLQETLDGELGLLLLVVHLDIPLALKVLRSLASADTDIVP